MTSNKIPTGWTLAEVGVLLDAVNGAAFNKKDWRRQGLPIIRIEN